MVIPDKKDVTLVKALDACWITIHGPPKEFITDGESGIAQCPYFQAFLKRKGIKPVTRAKGQHARFIERRGALVRDAVHRTQGQLEEEGFTVPFESILAESVFAGNAMLTVNNSTPYSAVYGRVPHILPGIDTVISPDENPT